MTCNISPVIAIIFMNRIESRALSIRIFKRYVDDIFILTKNEVDANTFYYVINNIHPNIEFELEHSVKSSRTTNSLSLPYVTISTSLDNQPKCNFYQKQAKKELFVHQKSHLPLLSKVNIIKNEFTRRRSKCSSEEDKNTVQSNCRNHLSERKK